MIEATEISKRYGPIKAVRNVSFQINSGEIAGLLGPNGAGKSTIMKILTGYHYPDSGKVSVNGFDLFTDIIAVKQSIGYLPEDTPLYNDLKVSEYLDIVADIRGMRKGAKKTAIDRVITECGLNRVAGQVIDTLSKGFRQRVGIAQAIIHRPKILILDEPTTGLDPNQILWIRRLIKELGKTSTILISTHILQEVEAVCGRVFILDRGTIVAEGNSEEIGRNLEPNQNFNMVIERGGPAEIKASLEKLPEVTDILACYQNENGLSEIELLMKPSGLAGGILFDWAVRNNYRIISLVPKKMKLEELFINLFRDTKGDS